MYCLDYINYASMNPTNDTNAEYQQTHTNSTQKWRVYYVCVLLIDLPVLLLSLVVILKVRFGHASGGHPQEYMISSLIRSKVQVYSCLKALE